MAVVLTRAETRELLTQAVVPQAVDTEWLEGGAEAYGYGGRRSFGVIQGPGWRPAISDRWVVHLHFHDDRLQLRRRVLPPATSLAMGINIFGLQQQSIADLTADVGPAGGYRSIVNRASVLDIIYWGHCWKSEPRFQTRHLHVCRPGRERGWPDAPFIGVLRPTWIRHGALGYGMRLRVNPRGLRVNPNFPVRAAHVEFKAKLLLISVNTSGLGGIGYWVLGLGTTRGSRLIDSVDAFLDLGLVARQFRVPVLREYMC
ncbi:hypothetical protein C8R44DRAFT_726471 [Mycena epipterygia]|nr:hypothetical protein C8R44DRAFT_726471 [Mycena epipterygia]